MPAEARGDQPCASGKDAVWMVLEARYQLPGNSGDKERRRER
jgi:hypothetical protein